MTEQDEAQAEPEEAGPDWVGYYRHTLGREVRPVFARGVDALAAAGVRPGQAVDVGFGDGTETLALLEAGWRVFAVDPTPAAAEVLLPRVAPGALDRLRIATSPAESVDLPAFELLYAGYALSFLEPSAFRRFWTGVRANLRPGGFLVVNVFGVRDTWAGETDMTFVDRDGVHRLLDGLEIVELREEDQDGDSFGGPKHWHLFDLIARRPVDAS